MRVVRVLPLCAALGMGAAAWAEAQFPPDPAADYAARAAKLGDRKDAKAWLALADFAEGHLLWPQREEALRKAVSADPENTRIHDRLGEAKAGKDWLPADEAEAREEAAMTAKGLVFYGAKWTTPKEADKSRADDRKTIGWDCDLRLDLPGLKIYSAKTLGYTRRMAAILLGTTEAYKHLYGKTRKFVPNPRPMTVFLFGDRATYLKVSGSFYQRVSGSPLPDGMSGFYGSGTGILHVGELADGMDERDQVCAHEMVHGLDDLLSNCPSHLLPPWIGEGMADYFLHSVRGRQVLPGLACCFTRDGKPGLLPKNLPALSLSAFTRMSTEEYLKDPPLHYTISWALIHFLFHAEQSRYAPGFRTYLSGLPSKGSPKELETALGIPLGKLEPAFKRYVEEVLGPTIEASRIPR